MKIKSLKAARLRRADIRHQKRTVLPLAEVDLLLKIAEAREIIAAKLRTQS